MPDQPTTDAPQTATDPPTTPPSAPSPPAAFTPSIASEPAPPSRAPLVISILALVVAGCAAALALWQMLLARQNQALSQRAFVHVSSPQAAAVPDPQDRTAAALALTALFTNSGNAPTRNLKYFMRCVTAREPVEEPWTLLFQDKVDKLSLAIGPHATANAQCTFTAEQLRQIGEGRLHGYVLGDITYNDGVGTMPLRRTQFSWRLSNVRIDPAGHYAVLTTIPQGQHNCADEECPLAIMTH